MQQKQKREDGDGTRILQSQNVVSFDNMRDTGIIEIRYKEEYIKRTASGKKHIEGSVRACVFKDRRTNIHYGIPLKSNKDGSIQFKRISLTHGRIFNLEDAVDREEWHVIQHWPVIEGSIMDTQGIAHFTIYDKDIEAEKYLEENNIKTKAEDEIRKMSDTELMDFALAFFIDTRNNSLPVVKMMLMEMCSQKTPSGKNIILERINDKENLHAVIVFRRGINCGLIQSTATGYVYKNNVPLGIDESASIAYMKGNKNLFMTMDAETKTERNEGKVSKVVSFETETQKAARLKHDAQQLGIKKFWILNTAELEAAIAEATNTVKQNRNEAATTAQPVPQNKKSSKKVNENVDEDF